MSETPQAVPPVVTKSLVVLAILAVIAIALAMNGAFARSQPSNKAERNRQIERDAEAAFPTPVPEAEAAAQTETLQFTIKACFGNGNQYEALCHDIGEECVLESSTDLPLYKPYQKYTVIKLGRKNYSLNKTNTMTGAQWTESVMRLAYRVQ